MDTVVNAEVRKRGKFDKQNYHRRFMRASNGVLKVYRRRGESVKQTLDLTEKTVTAYKTVPVKACACLGQLERYFVKVVDASKKTSTVVMEVADAAAALRLRRGLRAQSAQK